MRRLQVEEVDMDLQEAAAILKAVKTFEGIYGSEGAYAKAEAAEEIAEGIRTFVEDAAELGGFYTDLMCAIGEGDEVGIGADDPYADFQVGRFRIHLVHEGDRYGANDEVGIGADDPYADFQVGRFRIHLVHEGDRYGANKSLVYGDSISHSYPNIGEHENDCQKYGHGLPLVEFYDMGRDFFLPEGQLVTSYYLSTLLGMDKYDTDIAEMSSLCLQGDIPAWTISGDDLKTVAERLHAVRDATLLGMDKYDTDIAEMSSLCLQGDIPAWTISGDDLKTVAERLHAVRDAYEFDPPTSSLNTLEQDCKTASRETAGSPSDALDFRDAL